MLAEIASYLDLMDDLRGQVGDLVTDLPAAALNWRPIEGPEEHMTNSLAVMVSHVAGAEHFWIAEVIGGWPATRHRDSEFETVTESAAPLLDKLKKTGDESRQVLASLTKADLAATRQAWGRTVSVRWAILHVIDHTALHLGHMQITYQLWQGGQGYDSPRWFQRLNQP